MATMLNLEGFLARLRPARATAIHLASYLSPSVGA
jgi:hypothetical protein